MTQQVHPAHAAVASVGNSASVGAATRATPLWFGPTERPLFGWLHRPLGTDTGLGVVLCNPFGHEAMCLHRAYRYLAQALAERGIACLRFDYDGTGDSSGSDHDAGRLQAWRASISAAIGELQTHTGERNIALFGTRLGGLLALDYAAQVGNIRAVATWAPPSRGRAFVREELAVHRLAAATQRQEQATGEQAEMESVGFTITKQTFEDLSRLDLTKLASAPTKDVFIASRDASASEKSLVERLRELGCRVQFDEVGGYGEAVEHQRLPDPLWASIVQWFEAIALALPNQPSERQTVAREPPTVARVVGKYGEPFVREEIVQLGDQGRLIGVVCEPAADEAVTPGGSAGATNAQPLIVFLSGGWNHRVGVNRSHVTWGREYAKLGFRSLRIDLGGIGDSPAAPGLRELRLYSLDVVPEVRAVLDDLQHRYGQQRFVLVGLCAGAFAAFHVGVADARAVGAVLLNPLRFEESPDWSPDAPSTTKPYRSLAYYRKRLFERATWSRVLRADIDFNVVLQMVRDRLNGILARASKGASPSAPDADLKRGFAAMLGRGTRVLMVFDDEEPMRDVVSEQLRALSQFADRLSFETISGAGHIFTPIAAQLQLAEILSRYLKRFAS